MHQNCRFTIYCFGSLEITMIIIKSKQRPCSFQKFSLLTEPMIFGNEHKCINGEIQQWASDIIWVHLDISSQWTTLYLDICNICKQNCCTQHAFHVWANVQPLPLQWRRDVDHVVQLNFYRITAHNYFKVLFGFSNLVQAQQVQSLEDDCRSISMMYCVMQLPPL